MSSDTAEEAALDGVSMKASRGGAPDEEGEETKGEAALEVGSVKTSRCMAAEEAALEGSSMKASRGVASEEKEVAEEKSALKGGSVTACRGMAPEEEEEEEEEEEAEEEAALDCGLVQTSGGVQEEARQKKKQRWRAVR